MSGTNPCQIFQELCLSLRISVLVLEVKHVREALVVLLEDLLELILLCELWRKVLELHDHVGKTDWHLLSEKHEEVMFGLALALVYQSLHGHGLWIDGAVLVQIIQTSNNTNIWWRFNALGVGMGCPTGKSPAQSR